MTDESLICNECLAEADSALVADLDGWHQHEFGWQCPKCGKRREFEQLQLISDGFDPDEESRVAPKEWLEEHGIKVSRK